MLKRSLLALTVVAATAAVASFATSPNTTDGIAAAPAPPEDDQDDNDGCRRPPGDDKDGRRPPRPPHRRPPPGRGPRCAPPVAQGVLPSWHHEQSTANDPVCVAHNAQVLALFDVDHDGELNVDEWHAHLRSRDDGPHHPPHHRPGQHGRALDEHSAEQFALVSSSERQKLTEGANALSHVIVRLPLWFPLWVASLTTSSNNEAVH